jgi:F-type H+-transporting ATPase subunit delta
MPRAASARRYAQAVFELALENNELERWLEDLTLLADSVANQQFVDFVSEPRVPTPSKIEVIREALGSSVSPLALNLISLLATRNLVHLLPGIADQYQDLLDAQQDIERAEVVSAVPLDDAQRQSVTEMIGAISSSEVRLNTRVEPAIVGGMIVRIGDRVIDGSTRSRLQAMQRDLVERR